MTDDIMRFSESGALAMCEQRWDYTYRQLQEAPVVTRGLHLGTLLDVGVGNWWERQGATLPESWTDHYLLARGAAPEDAVRHLESFTDDVISDAVWLLGRYEEHYGTEPPESWKLLMTQQEIAWRHKGLLIGQRLDGVLEIDGELVLLEVKSYKKRDLAIVRVLPQLTWYAKAMQEFYGELPDKILYDGIYTYHWKTGKHPPSDSFDRVWIDKTPEQVEASLPRLDSLIELRETLRRGDRQPIANLSYVCSSCGFKPQCWAEHGMEIQDEVIVED